MAEHDRDVWRELESSADFIEAITRVAGYKLPVDVEDVFRRSYLACWLAHKNVSIAPPEQSRMWFLVAKHSN